MKKFKVLEKFIIDIHHDEDVDRLGGENGTLVLRESLPFVFKVGDVCLVKEFSPIKVNGSSMAIDFTFEEVDELADMGLIEIISEE